jgi:hypothetical protein
MTSSASKSKEQAADTHTKFAADRWMSSKTETFAVGSSVFDIVPCDFFSLALSSSERRSKKREHIELYRDLILTAVQMYFSTLRTLMEKAKSSQDLRTELLLTFPKPSMQNRGLMILLNHSESLWKFIHSNRYSGDAIEIASAMAGAPLGLEPRTSLDYFLAKKNRGDFRAIQFGANADRKKRISLSKRRDPANKIR